MEYKKSAGKEGNEMINVVWYVLDACTHDEGRMWISTMAEIDSCNMKLLNYVLVAADCVIVSLKHSCLTWALSALNWWEHQNQHVVCAYQPAWHTRIRFWHWNKVFSWTQRLFNEILGREVEGRCMHIQLTFNQLSVRYDPCLTTRLGHNRKCVAVKTRHSAIASRR